MNARERLELLEEQTLCPYAARSGASRGRDRELEPCPVRTEFMRDRDRIIHSKSFRRLKHKTQVYISPEGDHYRTRLTHTLEVSQIARTVAKALRLNEDLTEAISLGHDLGHTPFGHAGERALNDVVSFEFKHNQQSLRVVERLENMNLTFEVRDGIVHHSDKVLPLTLEGMTVRYADRIAYINHDIDDSIRAGVLCEEDIPLEIRNVLGNSHGKRIGTLVNDLVTRGCEDGLIGMSEETDSAMSELRDFMFARVYRNKMALLEERKVKAMLHGMFEYFLKNPDELPMEMQLIAKDEGAERAVCDYIAGMTDPYAVNIYREKLIPGSWQTL